ncbi:hypothetical protein NUW58_g9728 [Xylaria curta]|uniref:Uncharacterized protein n=1 Tax=Xylaria curta TaxID=42375 RepID=A0ACC1MUQ2_9PEZI|nr:hypothetical protein NUW58_g9728 [Xylaria curta]
MAKYLLSDFDLCGRHAVKERHREDEAAAANATQQLDKVETEFRWRTNLCQAELRRLDFEMTLAQAQIETLYEQITMLESHTSIINEYKAQLRTQRTTERQAIRQSYKDAQQIAQQERKQRDLEKSTSLTRKLVPCVVAMSGLWLSVFSSPLGFRGHFLLETHQSLLNNAAPAILCMGSTSKTRFLNTIGIWGRDVANTISLYSWEERMIVDCHTPYPAEVTKLRGGPVDSGVRLHHLQTPTIDSIYGRLIRPFMDTIVCFVEDFAGPVQSAATLARWIQVSMTDTISNPPRLLIVDPGDRPYSMPEIAALRRKCFRTVTVTKFETLRQAVLKREEAPPREVRRGFEARFRLMLNHLCEYSSAPFDVFRATDMTSPLPPCALRYVERFVAYAYRTGIDPVPPLALGFARESVGNPFCGKLHPRGGLERTILTPRSEPSEPIARPPLIDRLEGEIRRVARRSQILGDSIANAHGASLGTTPAKGCAFLCFSCFMRPPIHVLSCLHRICSSCLVAYHNGRVLYVHPAMARARVLVLENLSVLSTVCLLRDIRTRLFGPIHEYIDLVVGVNEGRLVTHDVFVRGLTIKESLEKYSSKKPLRRLKPLFARPENPQAHDKLPGSFQIALQEGSKIFTSWGEVMHCPEYVFLRLRFF